MVGGPFSAGGGPFSAEREHGGGPDTGPEGPESLPAFDAVVSGNWKVVIDIARRFGVPRRQCDDIAVEVFSRLEKAFASITSPNAIRAWLRTTTLHVSHEYLHMRITRYETLVDPDLLEPEGFAPSPEEGLSAGETYQALLECVEALEPKRRAVFRAYVIDEIPMAEIARRLGIPEATAYNRLRLARNDLKDALARARKIDDRKTGGGSSALTVLFHGLGLSSESSFFKRISRVLREVAQNLVQRTQHLVQRTQHLVQRTQHLVELAQHLARCLRPFAVLGAAIVIAATPMAGSPVAVSPSPVAVSPSPVAVSPSPVAVSPSPVAVSPGPVAVSPSPAHASAIVDARAAPAAGSVAFQALAVLTLEGAAPASPDAPSPQIHDGPATGGRRPFASRLLAKAHAAMERSAMIEAAARLEARRREQRARSLATRERPTTEAATP